MSMRLWSGSLVLALSLACSQSGLAQESVKIGAIFPITGVAQEYGNENLLGVKLAVRKLNAEGGINGHPIELVIEDSHGDKDQVTSVFRRIAAQEDIVAIVGPTRSTSVLAVSPLAEAYEIAMLAPSSATKWPDEFNDWTFRSQLIDTAIAQQAVEILQKAWNLKTAAILYAFDDDWGVTYKDAMKEALESVGVEVVAELGNRRTDTDFAAQVTEVAAKQPDLVVLASPGKSMPTQIHGLREAGVTAHMLDGVSVLRAWYDISRGHAEGLVATLPFNPFLDDPMVKEFVEAYRAETGDQDAVPDYYVALGYDAMLLMADAIERANTTTDRRAVRDALGSTKGFKGVDGLYTYDGKGDNTTPTLHLMQLTKDGFVPFVPPQ